MTRVVSVASTAAQTWPSPSSSATAAVTETSTALSTAALSSNSCCAAFVAAARLPVVSSTSAHWLAAPEKASTTPGALMKSENRVSTTPSKALATAGLLTSATTASPTCGPTAEPSGSPSAFTTRSDTPVPIAARTTGSVVSETTVVESVWSTAAHRVLSPRNCATAAPKAVCTPVCTAALVCRVCAKFVSASGSPLNVADAKAPIASEKAVTTPGVPQKSLNKVSSTPCSPVWTTGLVSSETTAAPI